MAKKTKQTPKWEIIEDDAPHYQKGGKVKKSLNIKTPFSVLIPDNEESNKVFIKDNRKINPVTNTPIKPTRDLKTGKYNSNIIDAVISQSINNNVDPYKALAIGLQESGLTDEIGHTLDYSPYSFGADAEKLTQMSPEELSAFTMVNAMKDKENYAKKLGYNSDLYYLQAYNGFKNLTPKTEKKYHDSIGVGTNSFYGVDVTKKPLNTAKNPVYGKTILSLADMLKSNPTITERVNAYNTFNNLVNQSPVGLVNKPFKNGGSVWEIVDEYAEGGKVVSEIWKEVTGLPWSKAKELGLTSGSYDDNITLRSELLNNSDKFINLNSNIKESSRVKKQPSQSNYRESKPIFPIETTPAPENISILNPTKYLQEQIAKVLPKFPLVPNPNIQLDYSPVAESTKVNYIKTLNGKQIIPKKQNIVEKTIDKIEKSELLQDVKDTLHNVNDVTDVVNSLKRLVGKAGIYATNTEEVNPMQIPNQGIIKTPNLNITAINDTTPSFFYKGSSIKDLNTNTDLGRYVNTFSNWKGQEYIPTKNVGEWKKDKTTVYPSSQMAHYLLDTDLTTGYQHEYSKNMVEKQKKGESITEGSSLKEQWLPIYEKLDNGNVIVKYKTNKELTKNDKVVAPFRQYKYGDLDWDSNVKSSWNKSSSALKTKSGNETNLIKSGKNMSGYGQFGGGSFVIIGKKPNGEVVVRELAGSLQDLQNQSQDLAKLTKQNVNDLVVGFHDVGSWSAKPSSSDKKLTFENIPKKNKKEFHSYQSDYTGAGLAFPFEKGGKVIKDAKGQWAHPGEITQIPSNQITMQGVPYPVYGISDIGHTQMMYPGLDYSFIGNSVTEYPMMQSGGNTPIYTSDPNDPRLRMYEDTLNNYKLITSFIKESMPLLNLPTYKIFEKEAGNLFDKYIDRGMSAEEGYYDLSKAKIINKSFPDKDLELTVPSPKFPKQPIIYQKPISQNQINLNKKDYFTITTGSSYRNPITKEFKPETYRIDKKTGKRLEYQDGGEVTFNYAGENHRVYKKESPTGNGKGIKGHIMVNHPTEDKGKWDTIDLTDITNGKVKTVAQGVASTKKWHNENPDEYQIGGKTKNLNWEIIEDNIPLAKNGISISDNTTISKKISKEDKKTIPYSSLNNNDFLSFKPSDTLYYGSPYINNVIQDTALFNKNKNIQDLENKRSINKILAASQAGVNILEIIPETRPLGTLLQYPIAGASMINNFGNKDYNAVSIDLAGLIPYRSINDNLGNLAGLADLGYNIYDYFSDPNKTNNNFINPFILPNIFKKEEPKKNIIPKDKFKNGGKTKNSNWEIVEDDNEIPEYKHGGKTPVWQRKEGKNPSGGLNAKGRAALKKEGHDIKPPQPEGGSRKKSFCARMSGMKKKLTGSKKANDPDSRINKALRKWKC